MTETAEQLRARAKEMKRLAPYADGPAYHREMQAAQALLTRAKELEDQQNTESAGHVNLPDQFEQAQKSREKSRRSKDLAKIHMFKTQLGLDDDSYRDMLEKLTGKRSAGKLTGPERNKVLIYMNRYQRRSANVPDNADTSAIRGGRLDYPGRPNNTDSNAQLKKIEALLSEAKRPWEYARAIAEHMHGKKRLEFCDSNELSGVIAALIYDAKRHNRHLGD